ncbi:hypothetical protein ACT6NA_000301, partial [Escherichia coli]
VDPQITNGGARESTVDELSKSWSSLKSSVGEITGKISDTIKTEFQSALDTVSKPILEVTNSATKKAADIAKNIVKAST